MLVEGEKADVVVMRRLFALYPELGADYQIVSYRTNIYVLYELFFKDADGPDSIDLLQALKSREPDAERKAIFDEKYTDTLLIFDLDPQDSLFTPEKIQSLQAYFTESSDMGRLYINYPMVEAFYHMTSIPDPLYLSRCVTMDELKAKTYKTRVNKETRMRSYTKFIIDREACSIVVRQNIEKAWHILNRKNCESLQGNIPLMDVLTAQMASLGNGYLYVLCTCVFFVYEYNPALIL